MRPSMRTLVWLFPVVFLIHDLEEILMVEWFWRQNTTGLVSLLPEAMRATTRELAWAVAVVGVFVVIATYTGLRALRAGRPPLLFGVTASVLFFNVFTHLAQSVLVVGYTPGVVTAVLLALPYTMYLRSRLAAEGGFKRGELGRATLWGAAAAFPVLALAHWVGQTLGN